MATTPESFVVAIALATNFVMLRNMWTIKFLPKKEQNEEEIAMDVLNRPFHATVYDVN